MRTRTSLRGFTLIELLLVIGIIAILASIVIVAINPTKQLGDARNAQRRSDVNSVLNAVYQYAIDNDGNIPSVITGTRTEVCSSATEATDCTGLIDLAVLTGTYLFTIPLDPQETNAAHSGYAIQQVDGRVTVDANEHAEQGASISVTR